MQGFFVFCFRSIGCDKSFVLLGSQNGLSGDDHCRAPKLGIQCGTNRPDVLPLSVVEWT